MSHESYVTNIDLIMSFFLLNRQIIQLKMLVYKFSLNNKVG